MCVHSYVRNQTNCFGSNTGLQAVVYNRGRTRTDAAAAELGMEKKKCIGPKGGKKKSALGSCERFLLTTGWVIVVRSGTYSIALLPATAAAAANDPTPPPPPPPSIKDARDRLYTPYRARAIAEECDTRIIRTHICVCVFAHRAAASSRYIYGIVTAELPSFVPGK